MHPRFGLLTNHYLIDGTAYDAYTLVLALRDDEGADSGSSSADGASGAARYASARDAAASYVCALRGACAIL